MIENRLEIQNVLRDLFITRMHRIRNSVAVITTKKIILAVLAQP